jgi:hypothetical protein
MIGVAFLGLGRAPSSGSRGNQAGRDPIDRRLGKLDYFGTDSDD